MLCQLNEVTTMDLIHDKIFEFACLQDLLDLITCFVLACRTGLLSDKAGEESANLFDCIIFDIRCSFWDSCKSWNFFLSIGHRLETLGVKNGEIKKPVLQINL